MRKKTYPVLILLTCLALTSCHPIFCIWEMGYKEISKQEEVPHMVGMYSLDKHSKDQMYYEGKYKISNHTLELKSNGYYEFRNLPDWVLNSAGNSTGQVVDKVGRWSVSCDESTGCLIELENVQTTTIAVKNNRPAILLSIGDPDSCQGLAYVKDKN